MKDDLVNDTISRAAALDFVSAMNFCGEISDEAYQKLTVHFENLPSATDTNVAITDTVSRAAVVDAIEGVDWYHMTDSGEMVHGANSAEDQPWYKADDIYAAIDSVPSAQPVEDVRAMCGECDAWNKYKNYPQPEQFNPCTVCQEFDCTGCKFRRT